MIHCSGLIGKIIDIVNPNSTQTKLSRISSVKCSSSLKSCLSSSDSAKVCAHVSDIYESELRALLYCHELCNARTEKYFSCVFNVIIKCFNGPSIAGIPVRAPFVTAVVSISHSAEVWGLNTRIYWPIRVQYWALLANQKREWSEWSHNETDGPCRVFSVNRYFTGDRLTYSA